MPEAAPAEPTERISKARALVAVLLFIPLLLGALAYHDAAIFVNDIAESDDPGVYRFKGIVQSFDRDREIVRITDATGRLDLHWNATQPRVCKEYVVYAMREDDGTWQAEALSEVLVFKSGRPCDAA